MVIHKYYWYTLCYVSILESCSILLRIDRNYCQRSCFCMDIDHLLLHKLGPVFR